jgi:hypothetical protein
MPRTAWAGGGEDGELQSQRTDSTLAQLGHEGYQRHAGGSEVL